jgi:hypothetical protein
LTAVTISPTFGKNERPSNGLETISKELIDNQLGQHYVVGIVQFAGASVPGPNEPLMPRVKFLAIEPLTGTEADAIAGILDAARKRRGLGQVEETLFSVPRDGFDFDGAEGDQPAEELEGQQEIRLGPDGPREVPPPSAEEELAERAEAKAAEQDQGDAKPVTRARNPKPATADPFTPDDAA